MIGFGAGLILAQAGLWAAAIAFIVLIIAIFAATGVRIVQPYEQGLYIRLGNFIGVRDPGLNWIVPMVSQMVKIDLRTQVLDVPVQEVITRDNSPTNVDAVIYIRVTDTQKAYFQVENYRKATIYLAQTTLRAVVGDMELDEILYRREQINVKLRDILDEATDPWGVKVEAVEIKEVDPAARVKQAMEEQTSSERERRATILRADGEKRGEILKAEGGRRARILEAEGIRQAKILEAEGERLAKILQSQGEAQGLRILSLGAAPLDQKALTVLSMDTVKKMADGQATKIVFPFEVTKLIEGVSQYVGKAREVGERPIMSYEELEKIVGKAEDVLGEVPTPEEIAEQMKEKAAEMAAREEISAVEEAKKVAADVLKEEGGS
jgi:regulator of protease activity HflC (stomatin/prohibitin superfamily)